MCVPFSDRCCYVAQAGRDLPIFLPLLVEGWDFKACATRPGGAVCGKATEASSYNCNIDLTVGSSLCPVFKSCSCSKCVFFCFCFFFLSAFFLSMMGSKTVFAFSGHAILIKAAVTWHFLISHDQSFCLAPRVTLEQVPPFGAVWYFL